MKIDFFTEANGLHPEAAGGGTYSVSAINTENGESVVLYVDASENMLRRGAEIVKRIRKYPEFLGLSNGSMGLDNLIIRFEIVRVIPVRKTFASMGVYRDALINTLSELKPVCQHKKNHYLISEGKRCIRVYKELENIGLIKGEA